MSVASQKRRQFNADLNPGNMYKSAGVTFSIVVTLSFDQIRPVCWSIVVKEKPKCGFQIFGAFPSNCIPKARKNVNVHFFIHRCNSYKLYQRILRTFWSYHMLLKVFFFPHNAPHVLMDFVVFPPGHGRSVTDFWGWDAHEAQLRCRDDVSGDIGGCSARRALKPKFY